MALPVDLINNDNKENDPTTALETIGEEMETQSQVLASTEYPLGRSMTTSLFYQQSKASNKKLFNEVCDDLLGMNETYLMDGIQKAIEIQQTIAKKAFAMIEGDSIQRFHRVYYAYLFSSTSNSTKRGVVGSGTNANTSHHHHALRHHTYATNTTSYHRTALMEKEFIFGRPNVLARLGQFIMEIKVSK